MPFVRKLMRYFVLSVRQAHEDGVWLTASALAFGAGPEAIARYWCERHSIPFLGAADIGHDAANKIVPFGVQGSRRGKNSR